MLVAAALCALTAATASARTGVLGYEIRALVVDRTHAAPVVDPLLVNSWALAASATGPWFTTNSTSNTSTEYDGNGVKQPLVVTVPGRPTGVIVNSNPADFVVSANGVSASAETVYATASGRLLAFAPSVSATAAVVVVDQSKQHASFAALTTLGDRLYATDIHNRRIAVFDAAFATVRPAGAFRDRKLPAAYAPFGIQAIGGDIFVTYAKLDKTHQHVVTGAGRGYVDEFTADGALVGRVTGGGGKRAPLNAPWGIALASRQFGVLAGDLLVANTGDGRINAYQFRGGGTWVFKGQLFRGGTNAPITVPGLRAIAFGNGGSSGAPDTLYFLAGRGAGRRGLFGEITPQ